MIVGLDTKGITKEYRMAQWAGTIRDRADSGETIKAYCERTGIPENTYFYWQRKLRDAVYPLMHQMTQNQSEMKPIPNGWAVCSVTGREPKNKDTVTIEIGKCRVEAGTETDFGLLTKVCDALVKIC